LQWDPIGEWRFFRQECLTGAQEMLDFSYAILRWSGTNAQVKELEAAAQTVYSGIEGHR
jgi:hypothetical protein